MRSNATVYANMRLNTFVPHLECAYYTSGRPSDAGGSWSSLSSKLRAVPICDQEPYGYAIEIDFNNADGYFDSANLLGKWLRLGLGASPVGAPDSTVSYLPYVKVWGQAFKSTGAPHVLDVYTVYCFGGWSLLSKWLSPDVYTFNQPAINPSLDNMTIKQILNWILEAAGLDLGTDIGSLDGKVDTWKPLFDIAENATGLEACKAVLDICKCVLIPRDDNMCLKYPAAGDSTDYTYYSSATHYFLNGVRSSMLFRPMKVTVKVPVGPYEGSAQATGYESWMGEEVVYQTMGVCASNADCEFMAQAILARAQGQAEQGEFYCRTPNCLAEIYDKISVVDSRGNASVSGGRVGGLYYRWLPQSNADDETEPEYSLTMRLGGLTRSLPNSLEELFDALAIGAPAGQEPYSPEDGLPAEFFEYTFDFTFSPVDYNTAQWTAGTISFSNGESFPVNAGNTGNITAPTYIYWNRQSADLFMTTSVDEVISTFGNVFLALVIPNADVNGMCIISVYFNRISPTLDDGATPGAPTGLAATGVVGGVSLKWNANTELDVAYYEVYRNTSDSFPGGSPLWTGNALGWVDKTCVAGTQYWYWVKAVDLTGHKSAQSTSANATAGYTTSVDIANDSLYSRLFRGGLRPWSTTLTFLPKVGDTHDSVQWAAGYIKWNDGVTSDQYINASSFNNITAGTINYIYFTKGSANLSLTTTMDVAFSDEVGLLAEIYVSATDSEQEIGIQPYRSKGMNLAADFIACAHLSSFTADVGLLNAGTIECTAGGLIIRTAASGARIVIQNDSITGYDATQARYQLLNNGTFWMGGTSGAPKISWNGTTLTVSGQINLISGSTGLDYLADGTTYKKTTANQRDGGGYGYAGLDTVGDLKRIVQGDKLTAGSLCVGLNMTPSYMGFWNGSAWRARIGDDGATYFGDGGSTFGTNNFLYWDTSTLWISGNVAIKSSDSKITSAGILTVDGYIRSCSGAVELGCDGVKLKGEKLYFYNASGANWRGTVQGGEATDYLYMYSPYGDVVIGAQAGGKLISLLANNYVSIHPKLYFSTTSSKLIHSGYELTLKTDSGGGTSADLIIDIPSGKSVYPATSNACGVGWGSQYWASMYAGTYYGKTGSIVSFQSHDDIALIKSIQNHPGTDHKGRHRMDVSTFPADLLMDDEVKQAERTMWQTKLAEDVSRGHKTQAQADAEMARIETDLAVPAINILSWTSLVMGAIKQLAARVEVLEGGA